LALEVRKQVASNFLRIKQVATDHARDAWGKQLGSSGNMRNVFFLCRDDDAHIDRWHQILIG
jgi:hypothetical protein